MCSIAFLDRDTGIRLRFAQLNYAEIRSERCLDIHARPEWDLRYFSNSSACCLILKVTYVRSVHGPCLDVWKLFPALCSSNRRWRLFVTPKYQCCRSCDSSTYTQCMGPTYMSGFVCGLRRDTRLCFVALAKPRRSSVCRQNGAGWSGIRESNPHL